MAKDPFIGALPEQEIEFERYELRENPAHYFDFDRRDFAKIFGAGIAVLLISKGAVTQQESGQGRGGTGQSLPRNIAWLLLCAEDGSITV